MKSSLAARSTLVRLLHQIYVQLFLSHPFIIFACSDRLLEGRLHEFDLPMLLVSKGSVSGGASPPVGNSHCSIFASMPVDVFLISGAGSIKLRFILKFPLLSIRDDAQVF